MKRDLKTALAPQRRNFVKATKGLSSKALNMKNTSYGINLVNTAKVLNKANRPNQKGIEKEKLSNKRLDSYGKKPSFVQRDDGSIGIMDEFNDLLMSQDIIEGFWDENKDTKKVVDKVKKEKFNKIVEYIKNKNITQDFNKIVYTILVIYYIQKEKSKNLNEYRLLINKGKKFLLSKGINYDEEITAINI